MFSSNASQVSDSATYIEDVFSTYLYTGNSSTQTINNGIDLAGEGGLVWTKCRDQAYNHWLFDTNRGVNKVIHTNTTAAQATKTVVSLTAFNSSGYTVVDDGSGVDGGSLNYGNFKYASWTFRKQPKFFDVVTYTGNGALDRQIPHNLGAAPGFIIVKATSFADDWYCWHRSLPGTRPGIRLNLTNAASTNSSWFGVPASQTSTYFTTGDNAGFLNANGQTYVAYLFAHDAGGFGLSGTDNVISCGSYTGNGSAAGPSINLGYEPQWVLIKNASAASSVGWFMTDNLRGCETNGTDRYLAANLSQAETDTAYIDFTATGFNINSTFADVNGSGNTIIYIAIRRGPMKVPESGTSVFQPVAYTATNVDNRLVNTGIVTDMAMARVRTASSTGGFYTADRLRGNPFLGTAVTNAEDNSDTDSFMTPTSGYGNSFSAMNGFGVGNDSIRQLNYLTANEIAYAFARAPSFFDEVCYTGTGSARTVTHNLAAVPELMIVKGRSALSVASNWCVYCSHVIGAANTGYLYLNNTDNYTDNTTFWDTAPTSSVFSLSSNNTVNENTDTFVAYLFASCPGVSKVGSYTGNGGAAGGAGTAQTINCGFSAGSRFVLVKCTSNTGEWFVFDSARGIVAGNDPYLQMQSSAVELTGSDALDTDSSGFIVNQIAATDLNVTGRTYIFLAIA